MKKAMKKARIAYNQAEDRFEVQINVGAGWGLESAYNCVCREGAPGITNYIHWEILEKLAVLQYNGYTIDLQRVVVV